MGEKLTRVEIRIADRIVYSKDVEDVRLECHAGQLTVNAFEPGAKLDETTAKLPDNPLLPPTPTPGAPDEPEQSVVIERVHTGEEYAKLAQQAKASRSRGKNAQAKKGETTNQAAADGELPPGAIDVTDLVFAEGGEVPHATVTVDGVEVPPTGIGYRPDDAEPGEVVHLPTGTVMDGVIANLEPATAADLITETTIPVDDEPEGTEA